MEKTELKVVKEKVETSFNELSDAILKNFNSKDFKKNQEEILNKAFNYSISFLGLQDKDVNIKFYRDPIKLHILMTLFNFQIDGFSNKNNIYINLRNNFSKSTFMHLFNTITHECEHQVNAFKNLYYETLNNNEMEKSFKQKSFKKSISYLDEKDFKGVNLKQKFKNALYITSENEKTARIVASQVVADFFGKLLDKANKCENMPKEKIKWIKSQLGKAKRFCKREGKEIEENMLLLKKHEKAVCRKISSAQNKKFKEFKKGKIKLADLLSNEFMKQSQIYFDVNLFDSIYNYIYETEKTFGNFYNCDVFLDTLAGFRGIMFETVYETSMHMKEIFLGTLPEKCPDFIPANWCRALSSNMVVKTLQEKYGEEQAIKLLVRSVKFCSNVNLYFGETFTEKQWEIAKKYMNKLDDVNKNLPETEIKVSYKSLTNAARMFDKKRIKPALKQENDLSL